MASIRSSRQVAGSWGFFSVSLIKNSDSFTNTPQKGRNSTVQVTLKKVWNMAIWVAGAANHRRKVDSIKPGQQAIRAKKSRQRLQTRRAGFIRVTPLKS